jgi:hypothetical protein
MHKVEIENFTGNRVKGWIKTNTDFNFSFDSGNIGEFRFVKGIKSGLDTNNLHIYADLLPYECKVLDLEQLTYERVKLSNFPGWEFFGGLPKVNGMGMEIISSEFNGNSLQSEWKGRLGRMFHVTLFTRWYEDNPYLVHGEVIVTCSNPSVPDLVDTIPPDFRVTFGDSIVFIPGKQFNSTVINGGETFADGQCWPLPIFFAWPRNMTVGKENEAWAYVSAVVNLQIGAVALKKLYRSGNPKYNPSFNPRVWARNLFQDSVRRMHTWEAGLLGPNKRSGETGGQEDQVYVRGEALLPNGVAASIVTYLAALQLGRRPCHRLEFDGRIATIQNHPSGRYWDGTIHWHSGVSTDRFGKVGLITQTQTKDWWGPDVEHWLYNTLMAGARITGSDACQRLLEHQGNVYQFQWTHMGGATSQMYAPRAVGWEGWMVLNLWFNLKNRQLASLVKDNYIHLFFACK